MMKYEIRNVRNDKLKMIITPIRQEIEFGRNKRKSFVKIKTGKSGQRINKIKTRYMYSKYNFVKVGRQYIRHQIGVI